MAKKHTTVMYALPWKRHGKLKYPDVLSVGPWILCRTEEMALARRVDEKQKPKKVRVTIE